MCGICGIVSPPGGAPPDRVVLERMTAALRHRGPDGEGFHLDASVGLGHRRLSIIDVAGGAQPMFNEDDSIAIVFNGEIYNYLELRPPLERAGHVFRSSSDTEVILHLYEEHGDACLEALNGMFAFALWDSCRRRLLIARDRLGEKPLYYRVAADGGLVFASELKALLALPDASRDVSLEALDDYLAYGYVPADRCIIDGVAKLMPGSKLVWKSGRIAISQYWNCNASHDAARAKGSGDLQECLDELEHRLRTSIRIRMRSDVPLGAFLSGGVDSSAIVALASQESAGKLRTYCVGFAETEFSELRYARLIAQRFDTDHHEIIVRDRDMSILDDIVYHLDEPFADPSALPTYYVCREARRHVTVCLSGDGADELFAGYARYRQGARLPWLRALIAVGMRPVWPLAAALVPRRVRGYGTLERLASCGADLYFAQCGVFSATERRAFLATNGTSGVKSDPWLFTPYFEGEQSGDRVRAMQRADQNSYLPDDILVKVDRMSMQNSLEVRVPFLDHTLVEYVNALPTEWKQRGSVSKWLLKRLMGRHLPAEILHRRKMGFGLPIRDWFRGNLESHASDVLLSPSAELSRWIAPTEIRRLLRDHRSNGRDFSKKIWSLLVLETWLNRTERPNP